ncbi:tetratricopeptide repeat protein [Nocardioides sp.]|uniref:tetratricopeptide repeat protein n=1 Tax=Nocardioides sp. TaxID=35761 RepID=UPI003511B79B
MLPIEVRALWDFADPTGSEARFRAAAQEAQGVRAALLRTQVARALGLRGRHEEALALLGHDADHPEPAVAAQVRLETGRVHRSAGDAERAVAACAAAEGLARAHGLDAVRVDALHMLALLAPPAEQAALTEAVLEVARASADPDARAWEASLLHNLGMAHADAGAWPAALTAFEAALAVRRARDEVGPTRVARWMVGWALRHLDRRAEALAVQEDLVAELTAAGESDPYVEEELALLRADTR